MYEIIYVLFVDQGLFEWLLFFTEGEMTNTLKLYRFYQFSFGLSGFQLLFVVHGISSSVLRTATNQVILPINILERPFAPKNLCVEFC